MMEERCLVEAVDEVGGTEDRADDPGGADVL